MPEGPEIRRAADRVEAAVAGSPLVEVRFGLARLEPWQERLVGATVTAVDTHGKAMLTRFDSGLVLYSHNQLYGRWFVRAGGSYPETNRQLRVELRTAKKAALLYSASEIEILDPDELASHPFLRGLGPDPLWQDVDADTFLERLEEDAFCRRQLGGTLLDQGFAAGLGNYLRSEILWWARAHPKQRPCDLDRPGRRRIARATVELTRRSYRTGGVTNPPSVVKKRKAAGRPRREWRFAVFGLDGRGCRRCGSRIERVSIASRRCYFCPVCQPVP
jgi:endonuclease-8